MKIVTLLALCYWFLLCFANSPELKCHVLIGNMASNWNKSRLLNNYWRRGKMSQFPFLNTNAFSIFASIFLSVGWVLYKQKEITWNSKLRNEMNNCWIQKKWTFEHDVTCIWWNKNGFPKHEFISRSTL